MVEVPVLGDEAYYVFWGTHPAGGYYDLAPMIGWWESAITQLGLSNFWIRIPNLFVTVLVTLGIYDAVQVYRHQTIQLPFSAAKLDARAFWISALYFIAPVHYLGVLVSPDVPLLFFSFFSALLFFHADQRIQSVGKKRIYFILAGALWGAALISKYFAVMMVPAVLVWWWVSRKNKSERIQAYGNIIWILLGAAPFLFQHIFWNAKNGYATFMFNFVTRQNVVDGERWVIIALYFLYLMILATPTVLYGWFTQKSKQNVKSDITTSNAEESDFILFNKIFWMVPVALFGVTAFMGRGQGLHWYLSYTPFFFIWVAMRWNVEKIKRNVSYLFGLTGVISVLIASVLLNPSWVTKNVLKNRFQLDIAMAIQGNEFVQAIRPALEHSDAVLLESYNFASVADRHILRYYGKKPLGLWNPVSRFGRVFDFNFEPRDFEGQSVVLISAQRLAPENFDQYFNSVESKVETFSDAQITVTRGEGFQANRYWTERVKPQLEKYYSADFRLKNPR
jgi:hypothetical protein